MQGRCVNLPDGRFVIGRDPQCDIRPFSDNVSRRHCDLRVSDDMVVLRDLRSTNGTFVNGERIEEEVELNEGDIVVIGSLQFEFHPGVASEVETGATPTTEQSAEPPDAPPTPEPQPAVPPQTAEPDIVTPEDVVAAEEGEDSEPTMIPTRRAVEEEDPEEENLAGITIAELDEVNPDAAWMQLVDDLVGK